MKIFGLLLIHTFLSVTLIAPSHGKTWLRADGLAQNTYRLLNSVLGGTAHETPDCAHESYGPHITQVVDNTLGRPVFAFDIHVTPDDDRCTKDDRQRVEIKTYDPSPPELKGLEGETVTLSWNFKINSGFQPSTKFTHIHQIKPKGGDDSLPLITLTPRKQGNTQILEVIYTGRDKVATVIQQDNLANYTGVWVHAVEKLTYGRNGTLSLVLKSTTDDQHLMTVTKQNIDFWRDGAEFMRPKWGIYRSLLEPEALRDERMFFDSFCLAKGESDVCL